MKSKYLYIAPALLAASSLMLSGCSDDDRPFAQGEGAITVKAALSGDIKVESRADADELRTLYGESLKLWLTKPGEGPVRQYEGLDNLPTGNINMPAGSYVAEAWAGDSVSASFDSRYFKGYLPFDVKTGEVTPVDITLKIANVVVSVDVDDSVDEVLKEGYTLTVGHSRGELTFEGHDARKGYFMMPSSDTDLTLTFAGTGVDGKPYTQTETIADAQGTTEYVIHIKHNPKADNGIGGAWFDITVDTQEILVEDEFVITLAPDIRGVNFDIARPQTMEQGKGSRYSVYVAASESLTSLVLESDYFATIFSSGRTNFDLLNASDNSYEQALLEAGITLQRILTDGVLTNVRINFEEDFTKALPEGKHEFKFVAGDGDLTSEATLTLDVSNAPVALLPASDISYTSATLTANILKEGGIGQAGFYVAAASGARNFVSATIADGKLTAVAEGLTQNTVYTYTVVYDGFESEPQTFTTLAYPQLPNAGFEEWSTYSSNNYPVPTATYPGFWDSGIHGAYTMAAFAKDITTKDSSVKHSGNYSVKMQSRFIGMGTIGALAAGNIFSGKYLKTDGTNGILGWGQPFATPVRPKGLKGYVKYTPVAVSHTKTNPAGKAKGDMDEGIIYIALLSADDDEREDSESAEKGYPIVVRTKTAQLFDKNLPCVIAHGELVFTEATPGDGMVEFTINLTDIHPDLEFAKILVVASSSRYGDYFTGGDGSTMWLDDLELIY